MTRSLLIALLLLLWLLPTAGRAQMDSLVYGVRRVEIDSARKGELRASVEGMPFLLNNEYKSKLVKGYTLPGVWLAPTLSYQPLKNLKIELGAHMLHFWGARKYPNFNYSELAGWSGKNTQTGFHCVPIFRAQMQLTRNFNIVLGTIHGKSRHGLIRPLYNEELNLSADPETGVQLLLDTHPVKLDAWVNWESFIFENDRGQESFSFGLSTRFGLSPRSKRLQWYIPFQTIFQHRGGEINTEAADRTVKTWFNAATGLGLQLPLRTKLPVRFDFEADVAYFGQQAGRLIPFSKGYGFYARAEAQVWRCRIGLGYWDCSDFVTILGNPLYGTLSVSHDGLTLSHPRSLTARLEYAQELGKGFAWGVHADVLEQLPTNAYERGVFACRTHLTTNFVAGIYLRCYPEFLIKKFGGK